jgi:biofilm PGA synthesis N-glycosyltransferase PgaC
MLIVPEWLQLGILGFLVLCVLIQLYYFLVEFSPIGFAKDSSEIKVKLEPVSVIICARNELKNLRTNLPSFLSQDYFEYQVIVVNDCSWDESSKYLEEMEDAFPQLKVVTINEQEKYQHGKKFAVTLGIKAAKYKHLLFSDADCKPAGPNWIKTMMSNYLPEKEIVLSYGAYSSEAGFLNKWIRFDTAQNAMLFLSRAKQGKAYMGVGRNLSYLKDLFFKNKGFASHYHLISGDDDLFINETANKKNVAVCLNKEGFTYSKPHTELGNWITQKRRHMITGKYYQGRDKRLIGMYFSSHFFFWLTVIIAVILKLNIEYIVAMVVTRLTIQMIIYWRGFKKLGETDLLPFVPIFDLIILIVYPLLAVSNLFVKPKTWK